MDEGVGMQVRRRKRFRPVRFPTACVRISRLGQCASSSFVPSGGKFEKVTVYPWEFGRQRMEREELEGCHVRYFRRMKRATRMKRLRRRQL